MQHVPVTYKIRNDQYEKLKRISEITKVSQAEIVRQALDDFLARNEDILKNQRPVFSRAADNDHE
jgi:hypothetical protein